MNENTLPLIDAIVRGNTMEMQTLFNQAMAEKMVVALDAFKTDIAQNLFKESTQIDELSKGTLGSYIKKAADDKADSASATEYHQMIADDGEESKGVRDFHKQSAKKANARSIKRTTGISTAVGKLTR